MMTEQSTGYQASGYGLELLAERLARDPGYMAWVLAEYRHQEGLSEQRLSEILEIDREGYLRLALCRRPEPEHFATHLRQIVDYTHIDGLKLANLVRQVDALARLETRTLEPGADANRQHAPAWGTQSTLSAARDRLQESGKFYSLRETPLSRKAAPSPPPAAASPPPAAAPASGAPHDVEPEKTEPHAPESSSHSPESPDDADDHDLA